ncbi:ABC transporter ATP-binding protein [Geodermatophilus sp. URMC 63]
MSAPTASATPASTVPAVISIRGLVVEFATQHGWVPVVDGVSLDVAQGEVVGLVGESGSGKTVTGLSIMGLIPERISRVVGGSITFDGRDLLKDSPKQLREMRGRDIAMVFQEPMTSLNPAFTVGDQIAEVGRRHLGLGRKAGRDLAIQMLGTVGIPNAPQRVRSYPHEFSGGMRQRVMLAIALACKPKLLIADEPTTALDVTVQAQILDLLLHLRAEMGMSVLMVTHDLGVVSEICDRVAVMYAGQVVETGPVNAVFEAPLHPYTEGLIRSLPQVSTGEARLSTIPGRVPDAGKMPLGCRFHTRCGYAVDACVRAVPSPQLIQVPGSDRDVRCIRFQELDLRGVR